MKLNSFIQIETLSSNSDALESLYSQNGSNVPPPLNFKTTIENFEVENET